MLPDLHLPKSLACPSAGPAEDADKSFADDAKQNDGYQLLEHSVDQVEESDELADDPGPLGDSSILSRAVALVNVSDHGLLS